MALRTFTLKSYNSFPRLWLYFIFCEVNADFKGELGLHPGFYLQLPGNRGVWSALHLHVPRAE